MPDAKTDEPIEATTAIPVNYTEENTTTDRLVEMTDNSEHDSDLDSSSHKPREGNVDTDMDKITDRALDIITTSINDVEITTKPTMTSTNNVDDNIPQNVTQNILQNLVNNTGIKFTVIAKSKTTESSDRKRGTTTTDEPEELVNDFGKGTSVHTTPEIDRPSGRPSEISSMNETEFDLTTIDALEITSDSMKDTKSDKITDRSSDIFSMNETEFDFTTISARETTSDSINDTETDEITVNVLELTTDSLNSNPNKATKDVRQELAVNSRNDTEEVTTSHPPDTMTSNELEAEPSINPTETNTNYTQFSSKHEITTQMSGNDETEVEPISVGLTPTTENVSTVVTETTAQNYTEVETTTIGLGAMTTNVTANDTDAADYPPDTTTDSKTGLGSTTIGRRSTTEKDKFTVGGERKIRNDTDSRNNTDQDFTTDNLLETTTKNFTIAEPITVGLGPTTKNDSNITEPVDTSTSRPRLSITTNNSINDTKMEVYTTETGTWANQGKKPQC